MDQNEEEKYDKQQELPLDQRNSDEACAVVFVESRESDHIDCSSGHSIKECNVTKRILHLLTYYQQNQNSQWYEYLTSLKNYNFGAFLEDWHQMKNNHLRDDDVYESIEWIKNNINVHCNSSHLCQFVHRYQRDRGKEVYHPTKTNIDYKNIILMDQFDSIHTFIFHSVQRRNIQRQIWQTTDFHIDDQQTENEEQKKQFIRKDLPETILECSCDDVILIIRCNMYKRLKQQTEHQIHAVKTEIIKYIKENDIDGKKLTEMRRKKFLNEIADYLDNKKLKPTLGNLYTAIMKYESPISNDKEEPNMEIQNTEVIWFNNPQTIENCNVDQIKYMANDIISNKIHKLREYTLNIVKYIHENKINGDKLRVMKRKTFMNDISTYLDSKKTKAPLGVVKLITCIGWSI
eukprot:522790_1